MIARGLLALALASVCAAAMASQVADFTGDDAYRKLQVPSSAAQRERNWLPDGQRVVHYVRPADADPGVRRYLRDNIAVFRPDLVSNETPLFLYLPGTGGAPDHSKMLLGTAASQGYRALGLMYNDMPATAQACQGDPDPTCSGRFRAKRIFGEAVTDDIDDIGSETVQARLVAVLRYLAAHYPGEGWQAYLDSSGIPVWSRIVVSGHSQGAGIAAFIARRHAVARVALFSSPWDYYHQGDARVPAPWLSTPAATPPERWFGILHAAEPQARNIVRAYQALGIPAAHVRLVRLAPRGKDSSTHGSVTSDFSTPLQADGTPAYLPDWQFALGVGTHAGR